MTTDQQRHQDQVEYLNRLRAIVRGTATSLSSGGPSEFDRRCYQIISDIETLRAAEMAVGQEWINSFLTKGRWVYFGCNEQWLVSDHEPQQTSIGWICGNEGRAYPIFDTEFYPPRDCMPYQIGAES